MQCFCRLAKPEDLENVLVAFDEYNEDEALAKGISANSTMKGTDALRKSISDLIKAESILIAHGDSDKEIYGLAIFYEKTGLPPPGPEEEKSAVVRVEENSILTSQEIGMEQLAPIFCICNQCIQLDSLGPNKFIYLEGLGVMGKFRGKGVATKLVQEFESLMVARGCKDLISCATSLGTEKILDRQEWQSFNTMNTKDFSFQGNQTFTNLNLDIKAYKKTL